MKRLSKYIIAGNREEARRYCHDSGFEYDHRRVIDSPDRLRGTRGLSVLLVGSCTGKDDWDRFSQMLEMYECKIELANGDSVV